MIERELDPQHPESLTDAQERLAVSLFDSGTFLFDFDRGFRLKSGLLSPFYIDLRRLQSFPDTMDEAVSALIEQTQGLKFDRVAGVPMAAIPMASLLANRLRKPQVQPRMETKDHGISRKIDGVYGSGETVLVVDDLITTAASKLDMIRGLEGNGLAVHDIVVIFDREQGGREELAERGYVLHSALKIKPTLQFYARVGKITQGQLDLVTEYLENPPGI